MAAERPGRAVGQGSTVCLGQAWRIPAGSDACLPPLSPPAHPTGIQALKMQRTRVERSADHLNLPNQVFTSQVLCFNKRRAVCALALARWALPSGVAC